MESKCILLLSTHGRTSLASFFGEFPKGKGVPPPLGVLFGPFDLANPKAFPLGTLDGIQMHIIIVHP